MAKEMVDYSQCVAETIAGLSEGRVLLASRRREGPPNVMTIGWGTIGVIWGRPIFVVLVRPSRYTHGLIEAGGDFTVNVLPAALKDVGSHCGTVSGRDHDKIQEKGLTVVASEKVATPIIGEAEISYECKVVHKNDVLPPLLATAIKDGCYAGGDFHRLYYGEILACRREA